MSARVWAINPSVTKSAVSSDLQVGVYRWRHVATTAYGKLALTNCTLTTVCPAAAICLDTSSVALTSLRTVCSLIYNKCINLSCKILYKYINLMPFYRNDLPFSIVLDFNAINSTLSNSYSKRTFNRRLFKVMVLATFIKNMWFFTIFLCLWNNLL